MKTNVISEKSSKLRLYDLYRDQPPALEISPPTGSELNIFEKLYYVIFIYCWWFNLSVQLFARKVWKSDPMRTMTHAMWMMFVTVNQNRAAQKGFQPDRCLPVASQNASRCLVRLLTLFNAREMVEKLKK